MEEVLSAGRTCQKMLGGGDMLICCLPSSYDIDNASLARRIFRGTYSFVACLNIVFFLEKVRLASVDFKQPRCAGHPRYTLRCSITCLYDRAVPVELYWERY